MAFVFARFVLLLTALLCAVSCLKTTQVGNTGYRPRHAWEDNFTRLGRRDAMAVLDVNQDNTISREEWEYAKDRRKRETQGNFDRVDKNDDGKVSSHEVFGFLRDRVKFGSLSTKLETDSSKERARRQETEPTFLQLSLFTIPIE